MRESQDSDRSLRRFEQLTQKLAQSVWIAYPTSTGRGGRPVRAGKLHMQGSRRFARWLAIVGMLASVLLAASLVQTEEPCLLYTSPSPRDQRGSRMPSSA